MRNPAAALTGDPPVFSAMQPAGLKVSVHCWWESWYRQAEWWHLFLLMMHVC